MPHTPSHTSCSYRDLSHWAKVIVRPAYCGVNGGAKGPYHRTYLKHFTSTFYKWVDNMWATYNSASCDAFKNRHAHWNSQITGASAITDDYYIAINKAQMLWAEKMHSECGCVGNIPSIGDTVDSTIVAVPPAPLPPPLPPPPRTTNNTRPSRGSTSSSGSSSSSGSGY